jgi:predicted hotdog family 3-hydroxylacyl-ACP dehydratase
MPELTNILDLIPQRSPMVLVDKIISSNSEETLSTFAIKENHLLVENACLSAYGLIENMAQTAAAANGIANRLLDENPKKGFIGAIKDLIINELPGVNTSIFTRTKLLNQILNVHIIKAEVRDSEDRRLAHCEMKIFLEA